MTTGTRAAIQDLYNVPDGMKAEIVNGGLVLMRPAGGRPGYAGDEVFASLREYAQRTRTGWAVGDNKAFVVDMPHRASFSPDAAFYVGPPPTNRFYQGAPVFAVRVRSENDYGTKAEEELAAKRADYFTAGTRIVWDVALESPDVIRAYYAETLDQPVIFRRGDLAHAEPAVPGWNMSVESLFPESR
jgi:Uma2 family endonuclease